MQLFGFSLRHSLFDIIVFLLAGPQPIADIISAVVRLKASAPGREERSGSIPFFRPIRLPLPLRIGRHQCAGHC
jgi:hypothetical protein